jgi:hypothetical protein
MQRAAILAIAVTGALACAEPTFAPTPESSASVAVDPLDRDIRFGNIRLGDQIVVEYSSKGCFHEFSFRLTFDGEADGVELSGEVVATNALVPPVVARRMLDQEELTALDRLLVLYRSTTNQWCTNADTVQLSAFSHGRLVREERYVDSSCVWFEQPGVMTFLAVALAKRD